MNVRFLEAARNDLREAIRYYNEHAPVWAENFATRSTPRSSGSLDYLKPGDF